MAFQKLGASLSAWPEFHFPDVGHLGTIDGGLPMLRMINKQGVESTDGWTLQSVNKYYYEYSENGRVMRINVEPTTDPYAEVVHEDSFSSWQEPHGVVQPSAIEKERIKNNVDSALTFMNIRHSFGPGRRAN